MYRQLSLEEVSRLLRIVAPSLSDEDRHFLEHVLGLVGGAIGPCRDTANVMARENGLDSGQLRQGSFFTREGKKRVSGTNSVANARELMRYLVLMEQGVLVDAWSSREIKRLIYLTDIRIRYAASPALNREASR